MSIAPEEYVKTYGLERGRSLGFGIEDDGRSEGSLLALQCRLHMLAAGVGDGAISTGDGVQVVADSLLKRYREQSRRLSEQPAPIDGRIEAFLNDYLADVCPEGIPTLPRRSVVLTRHGMGRILALPANAESIKNDLIESYRIKNGVLHNPRHDRRTTKGTFHVCEGGLPIPGDKKAVPKAVFAKLFESAMNPPEKYLQLPYTEGSDSPASTFVTLYLRPLVRPEIPGVSSHKSMEIRFFVPGGLVSNLDFVESIFGNAGDPLLPENDAGLDVEHWTGHTGTVILAPQMMEHTKADLGLPHWDNATERQRKDGMCWKDKSELYNDGTPFKITCRNEKGVIVTLISDNYYGYCKKEVKTQTSYATNLLGNAEEEHAGGAMAFSSYNLGEKFKANSIRYNGRTFEDVKRDFADFIDVKPEGYGIDKIFPNLYYIPEDAEATLRGQHVRWTRNGQDYEIPLLPGRVYMAPSGYKLRMEKHPKAPTWRLIGTVAEGTFCHKPCTVSGGGKSEISKSLADYMHYGPLFVADIEHDFMQVDRIFNMDYSTRWRDDSKEKPDYSQKPSRPILGPSRSVGSVIKLLTPSSEYNDEYNEFLQSIPNYIYSLVFIIKRFEEPGWSDDWREHFGVDIVNGHPGHELKFRDRTLVGSYLRIGFYGPQKWRTFKLRQDFYPAMKIQTEDDISVSSVVPSEWIENLSRFESANSPKFLTNCEYRLFQRPDEAIHRGFDKQAESDLAGTNRFISNFEPLKKEDVERMAEYVTDFDAFSQPMQDLLTSMLEDGDTEYVVCSANPRKVGGTPTKNPRYLQDRPDMVDPFDRYVSERGLRLYRAIPSDKPVPTPVHAVLLGRRNNPPDAAAGIKSLAVYNPIHYQELPELFMDFICSLTGKSPSTTGFGSEGALTKGPFNALSTAPDLNAALVSYILTGLPGFSSAAGHIGPNVQVDHDISLLIPEIWCRLTPEEQQPEYLIAEGCLEKLEDTMFNDELIPLSRLGYRITKRFVRRYFGRVFDNPDNVFHDDILQPELQDRESFLEGVKYIAAAQKTVAERYFEDGTIDQMCPPLQALLAIMVHGEFEGKDVKAPEIRKMFTREYLLESDWYQERLKTVQQTEIELLERHAENIDGFTSHSFNKSEAERLQLADRKQWVANRLQEIRSDAYLTSLVGTIGAQPLG